MYKLLTVTPYTPGSLTAEGNAKRMFICQYQFPLVCNEKDIHEIFYSQRINEFANICKKYSFEEGGAEAFFRKKLPSQIMPFLTVLINKTKKGMGGVEWSGYQVFADFKTGEDVHWTFQLFFKHPDSKTELYDELPEAGKATIVEHDRPSTE